MDGGSARCKASTYTGQHNTEKTWTHIHALSRIRTYNPMFEQPKTVRALDCVAIGTGTKTNVPN
jgi:hypothetical protein